MPKPDPSPETTEAQQPPVLERAPLAYDNEAFLNSHDGRPLRILAEYTEPLNRFRRERVEDTVVFFGSARFRPAGDPAAHADTAQYYDDARVLAGRVATWAKGLPGPRHRFVVTSGGGPGIMEAANRGAWEVGAKTIGLNIKLPAEQNPNRYITPALNFEFRYFFMRKFWFAYLAKALIVFPGGFGTIDEMFEILTLAQTRKLDKTIPIILYGSAYWRRVIDFDFLLASGAIAERDLKLLHFVDTPEEAFAQLVAGLEVHLQSKPEHDAGDFPPDDPAPSAQQALGPDIAKTLP